MKKFSKLLAMSIFAIFCAIGLAACGGGDTATVPGAPQSFTAMAGDSQVVLSWAAPASDGGSAITKYEVKKDSNEWITASDNAGHTFTGLTNGSQYTFKVRAVNAKGSGAEATKTATPASAVVQTEPSTPQNFVATPGDAEIVLTWAAPANNGSSAITGYQITSDNWATKIDKAANELTHTFTGLTNEVQYTFKVRAVNSIGNSIEASASATPSAIQTVSTVPQNFVATVGNTQIVLTWTAPISNGNSAIISYHVSSDNGANWVNVPSGTTYTFTELTNGTSYTFRVRAVNSIGNSAEATATAVPATTPSAPQQFTLFPDNEQIHASWYAPMTDGGSPIIKYEVSINNIDWIEVDDLIYTFTGLTNGTTYYCYVRAVNAIGYGPETYNNHTPMTTASAPQNFTATVGDGEVELSWEAPESDGGANISKYQVSKDNGANWIDVASGLTYTFTELTNGTEYTFKVRAVNARGNGAEATIPATPITIPSAPQNFTAIADDGEVELSWEVPANNGGSVITKYQVSKDNGTTWTDVASDLTYTFIELTNGTEYSFKVRAVNAIGNGAEASTSATPDVPNYTQGLEYQLINDDTEYSVIGIGNATDINIVFPSVYKGLPVTRVSTYTTDPEKIAARQNIKSIVIPNSVTSIYLSPFGGLESITLPFVGQSRTAYSTQALFGSIFSSSSFPGSVLANQYYTATQRVVYYIPASLRTVIITDAIALQGGAFNGCDYLENITLNEGITSIGDFAFQSCSRLSIVNIPDGVNTIGQKAFDSCVGLAKITVPSSVNYIDTQAFVFCRRLVIYCEAGGGGSWNSSWNYSNLPVVWNCNNNDVASDGYIYYEYNNLVYKIKDGYAAIARYQSTNLTAVNIAESIEYDSISYDVTEIAEYGFRNCSELLTIVIPKSILNIGNSSFDEYSSKPLTVFYGGENITEWENISIGLGNNGLLYADIYYYSETENLNEQQWHYNDVTGLPVNGYVYYEYNGLTYRIINGVASVAPYQSKDITFAHIEEFIEYNSVLYEVKEIANLAFRNSYLSAIIIPKSIVSIGNYAFGGIPLIFYGGENFTEWENISSEFDNEEIYAYIYYYSETENLDGQHWHYDDVTGLPVIWE